MIVVSAFHQLSIVILILSVRLFTLSNKHIARVDVKHTPETVALVVWADRPIIRLPLQRTPLRQSCSDCMKQKTISKSSHVDRTIHGGSDVV